MRAYDGRGGASSGSSAPPSACPNPFCCSTRSTSSRSSDTDIQSDLEKLTAEEFPDVEEVAAPSASNVLRNSAMLQPPLRTMRELQLRKTLDQAFSLINVGYVVAVTHACDLFGELLSNPQFSEAEVQRAYDAVLIALSKHSADVKLCGAAFLALASACSRLRRGVAVANEAVLSAVQKHQSSSHVMQCALSFFIIMVERYSHRLSEVFDTNGSKAAVLALRHSELMQEHFCLALAKVLITSTLDESLIEAGLIDVLVGILRQGRQGEELQAACKGSVIALSGCVEQWPLTVAAVMEGDTFDLIVACLTTAVGGEQADLQRAAWNLFLSITEFRESSPEQLEAVLRSSVPWLSVMPTNSDAVEILSTAAQVLERCCSGSNERRKLAGSLECVGRLVIAGNQLRGVRVLADAELMMLDAEHMCHLLHALTDVLHCKENRDLRSTELKLQALYLVIDVMVNCSQTPELVERSFAVLSLLSKEDWFPRMLSFALSDKRRRIDCIHGLFNFLQEARPVGDYAEHARLVYRILLSVFENAMALSEDSAKWRRVQSRVLPVLGTAIRRHLAAEPADRLFLLPEALRLIALAYLGNPDDRLPVDGAQLLVVLALVIQSLQMNPGAFSVQFTGCAALRLLLQIAPDAYTREIADLLRVSNAAEFLSSAVCEATKNKDLLPIVTQALSSTVTALALAQSDENARHTICENIVPAAFQLLLSAEHDCATSLLVLLCNYSREYRSKLATKPMIQALVAPLLSNNAVKHAAAMYRVLRLLLDFDDACVMHALDAGLLKVKAGKSTCEDRREVEALLRQRRDADNAGAAADADAAFAQLMAEEEAEAAAKLAAQQKRISKERKKKKALPAVIAAADSPAPDELPPDAESAAEEAAAPSADAGIPEAAAGGSEADASQKPRAKRSGRSGRGKGKAGDTDRSEAQQLNAVGAVGYADALSAAGAGSQLEEDFVPVETRKQGSRKQPAAEAAAPPSPASAPAPPTHPRQRQLPQPQQPQQPQQAAPPQPRPVAKPQPPPPVAPVVHPQPLPPPPAMPPVPVPMRPPQPFAQPSPAHSVSVPLMPWQVLQPARPDPAAAAAPEFSLFGQSQPSMFMPQEQRLPLPYRPPAPMALPGASSILPPLPSIFPSLNEQMAQVAITPRPDAAGAGLSNAAGEYNCFLNSIVQALFHVHCFRDHLLRSILPSQAPNLAVQRSIALVSALGDLFQALQRGVVLRRTDMDAGAAAPGEAHGAVAPTALRQALAALNAGGGEGAMNTMADAAEVLSALYDAFQSVSSAAASRRALDETPIARMFGFGVREGAVCTAAGCRRKVTHELNFRSFFHIVFSTALRDAHAAAAAQGLRLSFEELLAQLQAGDVKRCDKDVGGCGAAARVRHNLEAPPRVFTISLAWDAAQAAEDVVAATMAALQPELRPELVFDNAPRHNEASIYELRAMVCYYGSHYAAYARTDEPVSQSYLPTKCVAPRISLRRAARAATGTDCVPRVNRPEWSRFDDASVTRVGGWDSVCDACARGHLQPTVLFYERLPHAF